MPPAIAFISSSQKRDSRIPAPSGLSRSFQIQLNICILKKITIAIDGYSSTGKSTLAKQLAKHLGYIYVDTGAMYRAVTLYAMQNNFITANHFDAGTLVQSLDKIKLEFHFSPELGFGEMYLNGINVETEIRTLEVSNFVSKVAEISQVRTKLVQQQQQMGKKKGIVMDGRDIGTVVFPEAELKIFMTASAQTRAQRRFDELFKKGDKVTFEEVLKNVEERDFIDTHRQDSPLMIAEDAIEIDNSNITREEQFDIVLDLVNNI
jgi:CMP/dCMP kinase